MADTRAKGHRQTYQHETDDDHHRRLVEVLLRLKGRALLSGYRNKLYRPLEAGGWQRREFKTACYAAGRTRTSQLRGKGTALRTVPRTEVAWVSPNNETPECLWRK